ncbi:portal protein [Arthrobacter phage BeatusComedenti]|uniref:Portal protein n=1 Tax=Arthrobacter phage BeatusComedenti TaxID=2656523 RepID=A0A649VXY1_9CAUD|nr:portal protein [Arthrobacter phage BeatusComedenti]
MAKQRSTNAVYLDDKDNVVSGGEAGSRNAELLKEETARVKNVRSRRKYYDGTQFDDRNAVRAETLNCEIDQLAEHERLHAYSTQIPESVDFIASQMTDGFQLEVTSDEQKEILLAALRHSPDLQSGDDQSDLSITNVLRDALIAQDSPVHVRWDAVRGTAWPEFWDSEHVQFIYEDQNRHKLEKVVVRQAIWTTGDVLHEEVKKKQRKEWSISFLGECVVRYYWDEEQEEYREPERLGIPFIPWTTLRVMVKNRKQSRGQSAITDQALRAADRYNAVEQVGYLIARYNSHGNLAVIGDGATLKAQMEEHINKDVADILTFPGGTALQVLQLPTDPQMIEHQRSVLLDSLYGTFGLTRSDAESLKDMGQVTGYALEILNRKSDGTFNQIRNQFVGDFKKLLNMLLDMTAYFAEDLPDEDDTDAPMDLSVPVEFDPDAEFLAKLERIDPADVYPNREFKIQLGSGYVVDEALTREDFVAKIISRKEVLRKRGYSEPEINKIVAEIEEEAPPEPETGVSANGVAAVNKVLNSGSVVNNGKTPERAAAGGKGK